MPPVNNIYSSALRDVPTTPVGQYGGQGVMYPTTQPQAQNSTKLMKLKGLLNLAKTGLYTKNQIASIRAQIEEDSWKEMVPINEDDTLTSLIALKTDAINDGRTEDVKVIQQKINEISANKYGLNFENVGDVNLTKTDATGNVIPKSIEEYEREKLYKDAGINMKNPYARISETGKAGYYKPVGAFDLGQITRLQNTSPVAAQYLADTANQRFRDIFFNPFGGYIRNVLSGETYRNNPFRGYEVPVDQYGNPI